MLITPTPNTPVLNAQSTADILGAILNRRIIEAIIWAAVHANVDKPRDCLRSLALAPNFFYEHRVELAEQVAENRHYQLRQLGLIDVFDASLKADDSKGSKRSTDVKASTLVNIDYHPGHLMEGGRFMVADIDCVVYDGAAADETDYYFDEWDVPPWDTWLAYITPDLDPSDSYPYLVCWVPEMFVAIVDTAIEGSALGTLSWVGHGYPIGRHRLAEALLRDGGWIE